MRPRTQSRSLSPAYRPRKQSCREGFNVPVNDSFFLEVFSKSLQTVNAAIRIVHIQKKCDRLINA